jgi:hypothetical protein
MLETKESDLVLVVVYFNNLLYKVWLRVKFIDLDNTFVGQVERIDSHGSIFKVGDIENFNIDSVKHIYKENEQFCYGDNVTICDCKGLCRNK